MPCIQDSFQTDRENFLKTGFHAVCYIGTMPRLVQFETWFLGIIHCICNNSILCLELHFGGVYSCAIFDLCCGTIEQWQ